MNEKEKYLVIIPTLNPSEKLVSYIKEIVQVISLDVLVVNDGSESKYKYIFEQIEKIKRCQVFKHAINMGKGRALKNALNYMLQMSQKYEGVITVDSDGQHRIKDVVKIVEYMESNPDSLVLGSRCFHGKNIPFRSKIGNQLTSLVVFLLYGKRITDTQTGLRGIPRKFSIQFLDLQGERFEYEIAMLLTAILHKISIQELPIDTIYFDKNRGTHFRPIQDSFAIYTLIIKIFIMRCHTVLIQLLEKNN